MQVGKRGRTNSDDKARLQIRRALNGHAGQIAEKSLVRALQGDPTALLACAQLLTLAAKPEQPK